MLPFRRPVAHPTSPTTVNAREALGVSSPRARGGSTRRGSGSGIGGAGIGIDCADAARWASGKPLVDVRRGNGASRGAGDRKTLGGGARWGGIKAINTRWNANPQRGPSHHHTTHVPRALASDKFTSNNGVSSVPSRGASSDERSSVGSGGYGSVSARPGLRSAVAVNGVITTATAAAATDTAAAAADDDHAAAFTATAGPTITEKIITPHKPRKSSPGRGLTRATARRSSILAKGIGGDGGEEGCSSRSRSGTGSSDDAQSDRSSGSGGNGNGHPPCRQKLCISEQQLDVWVATVPDAVREELATSRVSSATPMSLGARDARFNAGSSVPSRS